MYTASEIDAMTLEEIEQVAELLTDEAREEWAAATRITHEQLIEEIGGESRKLYELIQTGRAAYAKR